MECQYCKSTFTNAKSLKVHQKTAKYCLKLQQNTSSVEYMKCDSCSKTFTTSREYKNHCERCVAAKNKIISRLEQIIEEQKIRIAKLEKGEEIYKESDIILKEIAKQPRITTTTNTENKLLFLNPLDLTPEKIKEVIDSSFTNDHLLGGQKGVARFAVDNLLKDDEGKLTYVCTDPSRHIYKYKNIEGDIERDVKAKKLTNLISKDVISRAHTITSEQLVGTDSDMFLLMTGNFQDIKEMSDDNGDFRLELSTLTIIK